MRLDTASRKSQRLKFLAWRLTFLPHAVKPPTTNKVAAATAANFIRRDLKNIVLPPKVDGYMISDFARKASALICALLRKMTI